jgi:hypothetical protein
MGITRQSAGARLEPPPAWHGGVISMQYDKVVVMPPHVAGGRR